MISTDIVIFGAGIAGLWTFHRLKKMGYDVLLLEKESIGGGQTIASQGIIHSGLKFSLAGKVNNLAKTMSSMPERWNNALNSQGDVDLSGAIINAKSQQLLIPSGFMGNITNIVAQKMLGNNAHNIPKEEWSEDIKKSGFKGSIVFMDEPVLDIPSVIHALAEPYKNSIGKIDNDPFEFLKSNNITAKRVIFTSAASNQEIAKKYNHDNGLDTQKRPLMQLMIKNAPYPLFAHLIGKTDKPVASITTHKTKNGDLIWYLGGGVSERAKDYDPNKVYNDTIKAFKSYFPKMNLSKSQWDVLPIDRVESKSKTDSWIPDTPTIHNCDDALYCWATKLTFAPMLCDMILDDLKKQNIKPSNKSSDFSFLPECEYSLSPWDKAKWRK